MQISQENTGEGGGMLLLHAARCLGVHAFRMIGAVIGSRLGGPRVLLHFVDVVNASRVALCLRPRECVYRMKGSKFVLLLFKRVDDYF